MKLYIPRLSISAIFQHPTRKCIVLDNSARKCCHSLTSACARSSWLQRSLVHCLPLHNTTAGWTLSSKQAVFHLHFSVQQHLAFSSGNSDETQNSTTKYKTKSVLFQDSDVCKIIDLNKPGIPDMSYVEAKLMAKNLGCRLVYLNKSKEGVACFRLDKIKVEPLVADPVTPDGSKTDRNSKTKLQKPKSEFKEFSIKTSIKDHDLEIKMNKMRSILVKGKMVKVAFIVLSRAKEEQRSKTALVQAFTDNLQDVCKVNFQDGDRPFLTLKPKDSAPPPPTSQ